MKAALYRGLSTGRSSLADAARVTLGDALRVLDAMTEARMEAEREFWEALWKRF